MRILPRPPLVDAMGLGCHMHSLPTGACLSPAAQTTRPGHRSPGDPDVQPGLVTQDDCTTTRAGGDRNGKMARPVAGTRPARAAVPRTGTNLPRRDRPTETRIERLGRPVPQEVGRAIRGSAARKIHGYGRKPARGARLRLKRGPKGQGGRATAPHRDIRALSGVVPAARITAATGPNLGACNLTSLTVFRAKLADAARIIRNARITTVTGP